MNAAAFRVTLRALVPGRGMYYFWMFFLGFMYFVAAVNYGPHIHILYYLILLYFFAYLSGSLLTDILVKPLALTLPGITAVLPIVILAAAFGYGLLCAVPLVIAGPSAVLAGTGLDFAGLLLLGAAMFQLVALACFRLQSTMLLFSLFMCLFLLGPNPYLLGTFLNLMPEDSVITALPYLLFALSVFATFAVVRGKGFRRQLTGKTVMTFADLGSPMRAIRVTHRLKQEALQREARSMQPAQVRAFADRVARLDNQDIACLAQEVELFFRRTNWKLALLNIVLFFVLITVANGFLLSSNPDVFLLFFLLLLCDQFYTFFWRHFSPLLPVSRERYFRLNLYKAAFLYVGALIYYTLLLGFFRVLHLVLPFPADGLVAPFAEMPLKGVFYFALGVPVISWIYIFIRGMAGYIMLMMISGLGSMAITIFVFDGFLQLHPAAILAITLLVSMPFVLQSYADCFRSDLVRSC